MEYINEVKTFAIDDFEAWGGAINIIDKAREVGRLDELEALVEGVFDGYDEIITSTMINDFIWFQANDDLDLWNENEFENEDEE